MKKLKYLLDAVWMFATAYFQFEIVYGKVDDVQCFGCGIKYFN